MPPEFSEPSIQDIRSGLAGDPGRNELILSDILEAVRDGRSPLLLTERKEHVEYLTRRLVGLVRNVFVLRGGMGARQRRRSPSSWLRSRHHARFLTGGPRAVRGQAAPAVRGSRGEPNRPV